MAVPFTRLASQVLDSHNLKLHDALKENNAVIAALGTRGKINFVDGGGEDFKERILFSQNANIAFRGKNAQIPTADDEGVTMATIPQRVISGAIVINRVEKAQVKGPWAIGNLLNDKKHQAATTWVQVWTTALLQASPGANDPFSLLPSATTGTINGILSPVAPASAGGTTAGISRADNIWWRNQYTASSIDISTEAGDATLYRLLYALCVHGSSRMDEPDWGLCDARTIGDLGARGTTAKRAILAEQGKFQLGIANIQYYNATLMREVSSRLDNKIAFVNSRDLGLKVLRVPGIKMLDQNNNLGSIPAIVDPFQRDIDSLNDVSLMWIVAGLVPSLLRTHGLADNIT